MRRKSLFAATAATLCAGVAAAAPAMSAAATARTTLDGTAVAAALQSHAVGAVDASSQVKFELVLKLRDEAGAKALLQAVSTPGSAEYRHYLTAAQWEARFSPTDAQVAAAEQWLTSQGFTLGGVSKDRFTISASGTAAQVESAFGTSLENYNIAGTTRRMATSNLSIPTSLAGFVAGAMGVNENIATADNTNGSDGTRATAAVSNNAASNDPPAPQVFLTHGPCSTHYGQSTSNENFGNGYPTTVPNVVCGYVPGQLRSGYGLTSDNTGAGVTIAIIDAYDSATINADATRYFNTEAPSEPWSAADFTQYDAQPFDDQSLCQASGWLDEQAIDLESAHSMAPDAHIVYVGAQDCVNGLFNALQSTVDNHLADVVSNSWGDDAGDLLDDAATKTAYDNVFIMAGSTGITVLFSSGDEGDNFDLFGFSAADYPPSSPYVTAVGGTSLQVGADGSRTGEVGWLTGRSRLCTLNLINAVAGCTASTLGQWLPVEFDGGSGGFTSQYYLQPSYQAGVVPDALSERFAPTYGPVPLRVEPDISLDADPGTGFLIGLHQLFPLGKNGLSLYATTRYGGTSLASPILSGIIADADQAAGAPVGFINPAIYGMDVNDPSSILDVLPSGPQGNVRYDYAGVLGQGPATYGVAERFRELNYAGNEQYCDATGNCITRPETQAAATGYDDLTGLGAPGTDFIGTLAGYDSQP
jgi:subtilase family serine protease